MRKHANRVSSIDKAKRLADVCSDNPEYLQSPLYHVFETWEMEHMDGTPSPIPPGVLRPWCRNTRLQEFAFAISLTEADRALLRELRIAW